MWRNLFGALKSPIVAILSVGVLTIRSWLNSIRHWQNTSPATGWKELLDKHPLSGSASMAVDGKGVWLTGKMDWSCLSVEIALKGSWER